MRSVRKIKNKLVVAGAALAAGVAVLVPTATGSQAATTVPTVATETVFHHLVMPDGTHLGANYVQPTAPGKYPAVVFVSAWSGGAIQDLIPAEFLAAKGFVVVNYATRGFSESKGESDVAGPIDIGDLSSVIDWTIANTKADPAKIGCAGLSYGAGICLLGAAADPRIRAVTAISPWSDLSRALYPNGTRNMIVGTGLGITGEGNGHLNAQAKTFFSNFFNGTDTPNQIAYLQQRSPAYYLDKINANKPAILMESAWNDSAFSTDQNAEFFDALTGPKRYEARPGDHFILEAPGVLGIPDPEFAEMDRWFEAYLQGSDTSIESEPRVSYTPRSETGGQPTEYASSFTALGSHPLTLGLGPTTGLISPLGSLLPTASTGWTRTISNGLNLAGSAGIPLFTYNLEALTGRPPTVSPILINRANAAVYSSAKLPNGAKIRGSSLLHLTITPKHAAGTIVAYLYDDDGSLTAYQLQKVPYSWAGKTVGQPFTVDVPFSPTAYDLPAGHELTLVIATQDINYSDASPYGGTMTFSSPAGNPSYLSVPIR